MITFAAFSVIIFKFWIVLSDATQFQIPILKITKHIYHAPGTCKYERDCVKRVRNTYAYPWGGMTQYTRND